MPKKGLLERLRDGVVTGDGGYVMALEKRGFVKAGNWTPEAVIEHPEAVKQLHREFLLAGSDVLQTFTFFSTDDMLDIKNGQKFSCSQLNDNACRLAHEVAAEGDALVAGGITHSQAYLQGKGKAEVQAVARAQLAALMKNKVDFLIVEYYNIIEEIEWAIEEARKCGLPVAASMCIGKEGDVTGVSPGDCAVRMARAGADVVGVNCLFDPIMTIDAIRLMKEALDAQGLRPFLMTQPNGFFSTGTDRYGYLSCPEYPLALESRTVTRFDVHKYARAAYDLGVRYIGGCCGFEPYHVRAIAEELAEERGKLPASSAKHEPWGAGIWNSKYQFISARAYREHWENLVPATGRPGPASSHFKELQ